MGLCGMSIVYIIEIRVVLTIKKTCKITLVTAGMKTVSSSGEDISTEHVISVFDRISFSLIKTQSNTLSQHVEGLLLLKTSSLLISWG